MPLKIVIVDNDTDTLELLKEVLSMTDAWAVECFNRPDEALKQLDSSEIFAVICDLRMPALNGFDFIKLAHRVNQSACYILISGHLDSEAKEQALSLGYQRAFDKPFNLREVVAFLNDRKCGLQNKSRSLST